MFGNLLQTVPLRSLGKQVAASAAHLMCISNGAVSNFRAGALEFRVKQTFRDEETRDSHFSSANHLELQFI